MTQLCGRKAVLCVPSLIHDAKNRGRRRRKGHVRMTIKTTRGTATARGPSPVLPRPFVVPAPRGKNALREGEKGLDGEVGLFTDRSLTLTPPS